MVCFCLPEVVGYDEVFRLITTGKTKAREGRSRPCRTGRRLR